MIQIPDTWTAEQRRQHFAEMYRNKGLMCPDYFVANKCPRGSSCSYIHVRGGETRRVPLSVCHFYAERACLRDNCAFFHGTQAQLDQLHAAGAKTYQPQDYMAFAVPPPELLAAPLPGSTSPPPPGKAMGCGPIVLVPISVPAATICSPQWSSPLCQYGPSLSAMPFAGQAGQTTPGMSPYSYTIYSVFQR